MRNLKTVAELTEETRFTSDQLRWFITKANENGLAAAGAIIRLGGRRIYIDADRFEAWIDGQALAA